jgi:predicted phage tail component-like protein
VTGLRVNKTTRQLLGERRTVFESVPGRPGSSSNRHEPGDRSIRIECTIIADTAALRRTAVMALADLVDSDESVQLIISDHTDRYWDAILVSPPNPDEWLRFGQFELEWVASPYAYSTSLSTESWTSTDGVAHTWTPADTVGAYPEIQIDANADISSFILTVNGTAITYGTPLLSGQILTISSVSYTVITGATTDVNLTGAYNPASVSMVTVDGDFPLLVVGQNSVTLDTPSGETADITVTWRRRYR